MPPKVTRKLGARVKAGLNRYRVAILAGFGLLILLLGIMATTSHPSRHTPQATASATHRRCHTE